VLHPRRTRICRWRKHRRAIRPSPGRPRAAESRRFPMRTPRRGPGGSNCAPGGGGTARMVALSPPGSHPPSMATRNLGYPTVESRGVRRYSLLKPAQRATQLTETVTPTEFTGFRGARAGPPMPCPRSNRGLLTILRGLGPPVGEEDIARTRG
jgi:hypothetical protein